MTVVQGSVSSFSFPSASLHAGPLPWEAHMLRSIQASAPCQEGRACRGDSTRQRDSMEMQIPWRRAVPSWGRRCVWAWAELRREAGWMQKGFSVAAPWQAVRQSSLANYNISSMSTVSRTQTLKSISEPQTWFRFTVPITFLLLLLIICLNWFILTN